MTDHASLVSVDAVFYSRHRTAAGRTNGQAVRLRLLFVLFLSDGEKDTFRLCQRRKKCAFLTEEKSTKRLIEATASNSHAPAGKRIPTAPNSCLLSLCSASQHSPCGGSVRLEAPRPQAQSCRPHKRSSRRLAASFRSFLVRRGKEHKMLIFFEKHIYKGIICKIILQIIPVNDILTL